MTNRDIVEAHYAASYRGDLDGMVENFAPEIRWTEAEGFPLAGTYIGTQAIIEGVFARIQSEWEGFTVDIDEVLDAGTAILALGSYSATNRTSGKSFKVRMVHVWRLVDGAITEFEQVVDSSPVVAALP
jgi:ketosteroid isomerase-like protein